MKTAREMFEELGYELIENNKDYLHYERGEVDIIGFWKNEKTFYKQYYIEAGDITIQELKAINKQIEELNWNE